MRAGNTSKIHRVISTTETAETSELVFARLAPKGKQTASEAVAIPRGGIRRVPTYTVGRANERRAYGRVRLALPLRVERTAGQRNPNPRSLRTENISSSGVYFLSPQRIEPGTPVELELIMVDRPFSRASVHMHTEARVVRTDSTAQPGWHGIAAEFDDIRFFRDEATAPSARG